MPKQYYITILLCLSVILTYAQDPFITKWITNDNTVTIRTKGSGYNYNLTWTNLTNLGIGDAISFNQPIGNWNTSSVFSMEDLFNGASSFNQSLGNWNIGYAYYMFNMLDNCGMNVNNYDSTLIGWASQAVPPNMHFGAAGLKYCNGAAARAILTSSPNHWIITGDSLDCTILAIENHLNEAETKTYPSPAHDFITVQLKNGVQAFYELTEMHGKLVLKGELKNMENKIDVAILSKGIYVLNLYLMGKTQTQKIVIQ